jgi:uncharacterized protein (DUF58 family)
MADIPILLLLLLVIAVLLRLDFAFYLVYVVVGTYALARWWTGRNLRGVQIRRHFTDHAFLGETITVEIEIANTRWWPVPWLHLAESVPANLAVGRPLRRVITLGPKERLRVRYELSGRQRGYYPIGPAQVNTGDLFGFAEEHGHVEQADHLTVYPRVIPLAHLELASRAPHGTIKSRQPIFADPTRVIGKRDYTAGDPLRSVDWKSSAHAGVLQVKKYEPAVSLTSVIYLNLNTAEYTRQLRTQASEWAIVVAASLAEYLVSQRQAVGLACNGTDPLIGTAQWIIPTRPGRGHLMKLLERLARVQAAETAPFVNWLPSATVGLAWGTTILAITPTGDEATCYALHQLVRGGLNPILVVVEPHGQFGVVRERARRLGLTAHLAADEHDLKRWTM